MFVLTKRFFIDDVTKQFAVYKPIVYINGLGRIIKTSVDATLAYKMFGPVFGFCLFWKRDIEWVEHNAVKNRTIR